MFETLGAVKWEREARAILGTADRTARPALTTVLTPAELRVALAVGEGMTNRRAATALALSPKTVDAHLQSIYRKLGLRSRTELALAVTREHEAATGDRRASPMLPGA
jgi:DNA-binding NarL/FixJ family response regulator